MGIFNQPERIPGNMGARHPQLPFKLCVCGCIYVQLYPYMLHASVRTVRPSFELLWLRFFFFFFQDQISQHDKVSLRCSVTRCHIKFLKLKMAPFGHDWPDMKHSELWFLTGFFFCRFTWLHVRSCICRADLLLWHRNWFLSFVCFYCHVRQDLELLFGDWDKLYLV